MAIPELIPSVVQGGAVVGGGLLYDEHVAGYHVEGEPQLEGEERLMGEASEDKELEPG